MLRHADLALYSAKREGRGRIHFYKESMAREVEMRAVLASDLQKAEERGELEAHFQALVDLRTGEVRGFESLLRWTHRERRVDSAEPVHPGRRRNWTNSRTRPVDPARNLHTGETLAR